MTVISQKLPFIEIGQNIYIIIFLEYEPQSKDCCTSLYPEDNGAGCLQLSFFQKNKCA